MTTPSKHTSHSSTWIFALTILLVVYVLSLGPVAALLVRTYSPSSPPPVVLGRAYEIFYAPLIWAGGHSRTIDRFYRWEFDLFSGK